MQDNRRDHLANERTYLAYLRTALAFIAFGFVVARFALFAREISVVAHIHLAGTRVSTEFGTAMAGVGILTAIYGSYRYTAVWTSIRSAGDVSMPRWAAVLGSLVVAAIGIAVAMVIFEVR